MAHKKISICFILPAPVQGGAEKFFFLLLRNISREMFDVTLVLFSAQGPFKGLIPPDIKVIDLQFTRKPFKQVVSLKLILQLAKTIKEIRSDILFTTLTYTNLMTIIARYIAGLKTPLIIRETVILSDFLRTIPSPRIKIWACQFLYPKADYIAAPSESVINDLTHFITLDRTALKAIPNGIDEDAIRKKAQDFNAQLDGLTFEKLNIVSACRLVHVKGIDLGIRTLAELNKLIPSTYWILGEGPEKDHLKKLAEELGVGDRVHFLGFQENPYGFMKKANLFFLPSRAEGFPNVLLEAMTTGLLCVTSRYNDSIDEVIRNHENGIVVNFERPDLSAAEIFKVYRNQPLWNEILDRSSKAISKYTVREMTKQYEKLFLQTIGRLDHAEPTIR
jgi:glycosyltransferase involved in cell wall biosynthesis